jgi:hypothetical protein
MSNLIPVTYNNERILTTEQLAEIYETSVDRIKQNFSGNKERFQEGKHYYHLKGNELKAFKDKVAKTSLVGKNANQLYLWTERGADRHCKILETDKAWEQFDHLEETYFRVKENKPACMEDVLIQSLKGMKEIRLKTEQATKKAELANTRIDNLDCTNIQGTPQQRLNAMIRKYSYENGIIYSHGWEDFRKAYNTAYHTNVVTKCHNYCKDNHIKKLSIPAYLTRVGLIEDALRVADKMLNSKDIEEVI